MPYLSGLDGRYLLTKWAMATKYNELFVDANFCRWFVIFSLFTLKKISNISKVQTCLSPFFFSCLHCIKSQMAANTFKPIDRHGCFENRSLQWVTTSQVSNVFMISLAPSKYKIPVEAFCSIASSGSNCTFFGG